MKIDFRVYIEDTDMMGVVYHSNYLNFFERGRTEWLRQHELTLINMANNGKYFAVRHLNIDYQAAARLDDVLSIHTTVRPKGYTQLEFSQKMVNQAQVLCATATVVVVCLNKQWLPTRLPQHICKECLS
jgi:acyl-CoA thioester hydrolase